MCVWQVLCQWSQGVMKLMLWFWWKWLLWWMLPNLVNLLVKPKDRDTIWQKSGVMYLYIDTSVAEWTMKKNILESQAKHLQKDTKKHMKPPSPIHDHHNTTGHDISIDNLSTVGREDQNFARSIKEAIFIRVHDPSLNRNIDKYQLPHILDEVLMNSPELRLR